MSIDVDFAALEASIENHPQSDSILSVSQVLHDFQIEHTVVDIPQERYELLPKNFIAQMGVDQKLNFRHVKKNSKGFLVLLDKNTKQISKDGFLELWSGITLVAEKQLTKANWTKRLLFLIIILSWSTVILFRFGHSIPLICTSLLSMALGYVGIEIFRLHLGQTSKLAQSTCSGEKKISDCHKIILSGYNVAGIGIPSLLLTYAASTIIYPIIADIGLVYIIYTLIGSAASIIAFVYQLTIIKIFCKLCISSTVLVVAHSTLLTLTGHKTFTQVNLYIISLIFAVVLLVVISQHDLTVKVKKLIVDRRKNLNIKYNNKVLQALFAPLEEHKFDQSTNSLIFGNLQSSTSLTLILSLNCHYCKHAFTEFYTHFKNASSDMMYRIILYLPETATDLSLSKYNTLVQHYKTSKSKDTTLELINSMLHNKNIPLLGAHQKEIKEMTNWCNQRQINYTPAVLLNGKLLPSGYDYKDMKHIARSLL